MKKSDNAFLDVQEYLFEEGLKTEEEVAAIRALSANGKLDISSFVFNIDRGAE